MPVATYYYEKVYAPRWMTLLMAILAIVQASAAAATFALGGPIAVVTALGIAALLVAGFADALRWFEVTIDAEGVRYGWAGLPAGAIPRAEIAHATVEMYPWYYGYGWRFNRGTVCYSMPFERLALSVLRSRGLFRRYMFTLKDPKAAAEAIRALTTRSQPA